MCWHCMGLGVTGDAMDYLQAQYDSDWEREKPPTYTPREIL